LKNSIDKTIFLLLFSWQLLFAGMTAFEIKPSSMKESSYEKIKILDSKRLKFDDISGVKISELSGLAYKNGYLYAVSDKGYLVVFRLLIKHNKIIKLTFVHKYKLRKKHSKIHHHDSEGLALKGDDLLISFEGKERVNLFTPEGVKIKKIHINKALQNLELYKSKNKGLEAVAYNKKYGIITAPEEPLKNVDKKYHRLYSNTNIYKFQAYGNITGLEFIDENNIVVLLRSYHYFLPRRYTALVKVDLSSCNKNHLCKSELLAAFDSNKGWNIDNFEGVTKVGKNRFIMVSDDNNNMFQKTLLVLFEIKED